MKIKRIVITSKDDSILYKVAVHIYNISNFPVVSINIINKNKAVIYYRPFKARMKR